MRTVLTTSMAGTLLVAFMKLAPTVCQECIGSLSQLVFFEYIDPLLAIPFEVTETRRYTLCSDVTFNSGLAPLLLAKPNVEIFCGETGSSDNGCYLVGGVVQAVISDNGIVTSDAVNNLCSQSVIAPKYQALCDTYYPSEPSNFPSYFVENVVVKGLTFTDDTGIVQRNILSSNATGDVTFDDCKFMNSRVALHMGTPDEESIPPSLAPSSTRTEMPSVAPTQPPATPVTEAPSSAVPILDTGSPSAAPSTSPLIESPSSSPSSSPPIGAPSSSPSLSSPVTVPSSPPSTSLTNDTPSSSPTTLVETPSSSPSIASLAEAPSSAPSIAVPMQVPSSSPSDASPIQAPSSSPSDASLMEAPSFSPSDASLMEAPSFSPSDASPMEAPSSSPSDASPIEAPSFSPSTLSPSTPVPNISPIPTPSPTSIPFAPPVTSRPSESPSASPSTNPISSGFVEWMIGGRSLAGTFSDASRDEMNRKLTEHSSGLTVTLSNCVFSGNLVRMGFEEGLINNYGQTLIVNKCDFTNTEGTWVIGNIDGSLTLTDNCFYNSNIETGLVINRSGIYRTSGNFAGETNVLIFDTTCDYLLDFVDDASRPECIAFEESTCVLNQPASSGTGYAKMSFGILALATGFIIFV